MIPLSKKEEKMHNKQKVCHICKKRFSTDGKKKYFKVKDHCNYTGKYRGAAHDIYNLRYKIPKEIPAVFHNDSTYDYHFIIKELAEESEGEFECLGENTEKYITFSKKKRKEVPIEKEITKIVKYDNGKIIKISYKIKFINSFRFMSSSLSSLVDNLSEGLHSEKCADCKSCLDDMITQDDQLIFRCFECKKNYEFCNEDINKFIQLLRKGVYPYEYMDS